MSARVTDQAVASAMARLEDLVGSAESCDPNRPALRTMFIDKARGFAHALNLIDVLNDHDYRRFSDRLNAAEAEDAIAKETTCPQPTE